MLPQLRCILPKWNPRKQQHSQTYLVPLKRPSRFSTKTELTFYLGHLSFEAKITCRNVSQIADVWDISFQPKSSTEARKGLGETDCRVWGGADCYNVPFCSWVKIPWRWRKIMEDYCTSRRGNLIWAHLHALWNSAVNYKGIYRPNFADVFYEGWPETARTLAIIKGPRAIQTWRMISQVPRGGGCGQHIAHTKQEEWR